jgi:hypothetical protein
MPPKQIIALGVQHNLQLKGHPLNDRFGQVISSVREKYLVQIILEEWVNDRQSFGSTVDSSKLKWRNVGTPDDERFETYAYGLNTDPMRYDPKKPMVQEYGPFDVHEEREKYMVDRIKEAMEPYSVGLFIVGLGHLHSTLPKLKTVGFDIRGYSWLGD